MEPKDYVDLMVQLGTMKSAIDNNTKYLDDVRNLLRIQNGQVRQHSETLVGVGEWRKFTDEAIRSINDYLDAMDTKLDSVIRTQDREATLLASVRKNWPIIAGVLIVVVYQLGLFDLVIGLLT